MLCHFEAHYYWSHLSAGCALVGLPAVMHGLPSSMAPRCVPPGVLPYAPTSTTPRYSAMSASEYCWICNKGNSRPVRTPVSGTSVVRGLRCAHPRLSPIGFRLRGHVFQTTWRRGEDVEELGLGVLPYALTHNADGADDAERRSMTSAKGA